MSFQAQTAVAAIRGLKPLDKLLLLTLANYAGADGSCFPSQTTLAADTGMSERAVRGHLADLEAQGMIQRTARRREDGSRTADLILLCLDKRHAVPVDPRTTGTACRGVGQEVPGGGAPRAGHEPIIEPVNEPKGFALVGESPRKAPSRKCSSKFAPEDWIPSAAHQVKAQELGLDIAEQASRFKNHEFASPKSDFDRAFHNWLTRAHGFQTPANQNRPRRPMEGYCALDQAIAGLGWDQEGRAA